MSAIGTGWKLSSQRAAAKRFRPPNRYP